jgi:hypothetical protein
LHLVDPQDLDLGRRAQEVLNALVALDLARRLDDNRYAPQPGRLLPAGKSVWGLNVPDTFARDTFCRPLRLLKACVNPGGGIIPPLRGGMADSDHQVRATNRVRIVSLCSHFSGRIAYSSVLFLERSKAGIFFLVLAERRAGTTSYPIY